LLRKVEDFEILEFSKLFSDIHSPVSLRISCVKPKNNYAVPQENVGNSKRVSNSMEIWINIE
jgi:hypothetical protein